MRVDAHALQANLRRDDSSQYGGKTTGAIAYGYRFASGARATVGYSTGFKAPSFNDLYYPNFSNPDLVPETSENIEAGAHWNGTIGGAAVEARAVAYRNRVSQLIVFQCDANFVCVPHNVDRATLEGVTLGFEARDEAGIALSASLDLQSPEDDRDLRQELFNLRLQQQTARLERPSRLRDVRRDIARIETVLSERRLAPAASA